MDAKHDSGIQLLNDVVADIHHIGEILQLEDSMITVLTEPRGSNHFTLYVPRDNGNIDILHGWRSKHRALSGGKYRGGFLFHPNASEEMMIAKAILMTWKQALVGPDKHHRIPYGGAKGGVRCNIDAYTPNEQDRLIHDLVTQLDPVIGPGWDELGPDLKFYPHLIGWFYKYYKEHHQKDVQCGAIITGKPPDAGGAVWRPPATGHGLHMVIEELRKMRAFSFSGGELTCITHGFGQVGGWFARFANEFGLKIIGACDEFEGVMNPRGLDIERLFHHMREAKSLRGAPNGEIMTPNVLLEQPCDILALNSIEGVVHEKNADRIRAYCIIEGANGPITKEALHILEEKRKLIIPGILANTGGVIASYFEVLQEIQGEFRTEKQVYHDQKLYMKGGVERMLHASERFHVPWHTGALIAAIEYVVRVLRQKHSFFNNKPVDALV